MLALGFYCCSFLMKYSQIIGFHFEDFFAICFQDDLRSWEFRFIFFWNKNNMYRVPIGFQPKKMKTSYFGDMSVLQVFSPVSELGTADP